MGVIVAVCTQVLVRLCSRPSPAEELARKDDLTLLFSAITSWCPGHNVPWRKSAAEVLMTLSRHGLTPNVVQYIHSTCMSRSFATTTLPRSSTELNHDYLSNKTCKNVLQIFRVLFYDTM